MTQTWTIKGQTYTHGQLMELKRQKLDPLKDEFELKAVTPRKVVEVLPPAVESSTDVEVTKDVPLWENLGWAELKEMARNAGMEVKKATKKEDILAYLKK